ncbi:hypothetical protein [Gloeocapsa sp. PCC 73106]|uniref:hypothetical protein n=1 Tax=Gloeocapsa sp. PCC 73106 TaxID=102232 RepID=UPI0002ACE172|nr:hypothetical protein [Gloeocapsa sp. PCC 73106]ELR98966.1 hypothetical protein GLO73106DRAFT_00028090 [Gloeocapsa sp. PCC 73106]
MLKKILSGLNKQSQNGQAKKSKNGFYLEIEDKDASTDHTLVEQNESTEVVTEAIEAPAKSARAKKQKVAAKTEATQDSDKPDWLKLLSQNKQETQASTPEESKTFADKHLLPIYTNSRRRPGASLSKYMDMASQIKTPKIKR